MKNLNYTRLKLESLTPESIGRPIMHKQQNDAEYGIIVGFDHTHVFVHFNNLPGALVLRDIHLYTVEVKSN